MFARMASDVYLPSCSELHGCKLSILVLYFILFLVTSSPLTVQGIADKYASSRFFFPSGSDILGHPMIVEPSHQQRVSK